MCFIQITRISNARTTLHVLLTCNKHLHVFKTDSIVQFEVRMISKLHNNYEYESVCNHIIEVRTYTVG